MEKNKMLDMFFHILTQISPISKEEFELLKSHMNIKEIKKGDYFIREGDIPSTIAFVYSGLFRITYLREDGKEFTKSFFPENSFVVAYSALIQNRESYFSIEALEDSFIVDINYKEWKSLCEDSLNWQKVIVALLEEAFCKKEAREREFLLYDAKARYESFLENSSHLVPRIKQHILASYLGITPVALSNLKNSKN